MNKPRSYDCVKCGGRNDYGPGQGCTFKTAVSDGGMTLEWLEQSCVGCGYELDFTIKQWHEGRDADN